MAGLGLAVQWRLSVRQIWRTCDVGSNCNSLMGTRVPFLRHETTSRMTSWTGIPLYPVILWQFPTCLTLSRQKILTSDPKLADSFMQSDCPRMWSRGKRQYILKLGLRGWKRGRGWGMLKVLRSSHPENDCPPLPVQRNHVRQCSLQKPCLLQKIARGMNKFAIPLVSP